MHKARKEKEGVCVILRHFRAKCDAYFCLFLFFLMWESCEDEEHSKLEVHSGMSAGRGISEGRAQGYRVLQPLGKL